jgi:transcriptional regulator with XRE-family HTH domain
MTKKKPKLTDPLTIAQTRAARGLLGWSQDELAAKSGVGISTVADFEAKRRVPRDSSMVALRLAFQTAGLVFVNEGASEGVTAPASVCRIGELKSPKLTPAEPVAQLTRAEAIKRDVHWSQLPTDEPTG